MVRTRERLLDAAIDVVARDGAGALTNRSLARAAGVSLGSITYHFATQQDLLREALGSYVDAEVRRLQAFVESVADLPPEEALRRISASLADDAGRRHAKLDLFGLAARDAALHDAAAKCFTAYEDLVRAAARVLGVALDDTQVAIVVATVDGLLLRRLATGGEAPSTSDALGALLSALHR